MVRGATEHFKRDLVAMGNKWSGESIYPALRTLISATGETPLLPMLAMSLSVSRGGPTKD